MKKTPTVIKLEVKIQDLEERLKNNRTENAKYRDLIGKLETIVGKPVDTKDRYSYTKRDSDDWTLTQAVIDIINEKTYATTERKIAEARVEEVKRAKDELFHLVRSLIKDETLSLEIKEALKPITSGQDIKSKIIGRDDNNAQLLSLNLERNIP